MTRLEVLEQRLAALETEVAELRIQIRGPAAEPARRPALGWDPAPTPTRRQEQAPAPPPPEAWSTPPLRPTKPPPAARPTLPPPAPPAKPRREIDYSALFGAFGLAVAGGIVTVLGIVFFFVLAANRGWIGPECRSKTTFERHPLCVSGVNHHCGLPSPPGEWRVPFVPRMMVWSP